MLTGNRPLSAAHGPRTGYPDGVRVEQVIERRAAERPDAVALRMNGTELSYAELVAGARTAAARLAALGVRPGDVVAVRAARGPRTVVVLLGVLMAGAAYACVPADWPERRHQALLRTTGAVLRVHDDPDDTSGDVPAVHLPDLLRAGAPAPAPGRRPGGSDACCVFFTSGTTGEPKAVLAPHRGVLRTALDPAHVLPGPMVSLQIASPAWDVFALELWVPLLRGGTCVVHDGAHLTGGLLRAHVRDGVNTLALPATLFNALVEDDPDAFGGLGLLLTGGARASARHLARCRAAHPRLRVVNDYGPVENTISSAAWTADDTAGDDVPIGTPVANSSVYVLDEEYRVLPRGERGQLAVAGDGLSLGYLGDEPRTRERFPVLALPDGTRRVYLTGDLARMDEHGRLFFLGRRDRQIKVRGLRVEAEEIERLTEAVPGVGRACALALPLDAPAKTQLAAFYTTTDGAVPADAVRRALADTLPPGFVPDLIIPLAELPLTTNGKVDERTLAALTTRSAQDTPPARTAPPAQDASSALAAPSAPGPVEAPAEDALAASSAPPVRGAPSALAAPPAPDALAASSAPPAQTAPSAQDALAASSAPSAQTSAPSAPGTTAPSAPGPAEASAEPPAEAPADAPGGTPRLVLDTVADLLGRPVAPDEDVFCHGATSLTAIRLATRLGARLARRIEASDVLTARTPRAIAALADAAPPAEGPAAPTGAPLRAPLVQAGFWAASRDAGHLDEDVVPMLYRLPDGVDTAVLSAALDAVIARHDVLRARFSDGPRLPGVRVVPASETGQALTTHAAAPSERQAREAALAWLPKPFDLTAQAPLRAALFPVTGGRLLLAVAVHHIAFDGWSCTLFLRDLERAHTALAAGRPAFTDTAPSYYRAAADQWDRHRAGYAQAVWSWREHADGARELRFPLDAPRPWSGPAAELPLEIGEELRGRAERAAAASGATGLAVFHAAFVRLLRETTGAAEPVVAVPSTGRFTEETASVVGSFASMLPLRTPATARTGPELVENAARSLRRAMRPPLVPMEAIMPELPEGCRRHPLLQAHLLQVELPPARLALGDEYAVRLHVPQERALPELTVELWLPPADGDGVLRYRTDALTPAHAAELAARLPAGIRRICEELEAHPTSPSDTATDTATDTETHTHTDPKEER
ncbi:AMP-binding protein [Streptomyces sp. NPDC059708]|uniref:AMP-binding protein n=1 Tax=Streptomyces sp. NPDC059708 TaxID=3346916 RepID=UPI003681211A